MAPIYNVKLTNGKGASIVEPLHEIVTDLVEAIELATVQILERGNAERIDFISEHDDRYVDVVENLSYLFIDLSSYGLDNGYINISNLKCNVKKEDNK